MSAAGFRALRASVADAVTAAGTPGSARQRMICAARAYCRFALEQPGPFALMFRFDLVDRTDPGLVEASHAAFGQLAGLVADAQAEGWQPGTDPRLLAGAVWSAVHGLSSLWLAGAIQTATQAHRIEDILGPLLTILDPGGGTQ